MESIDKAFDDWMSKLDQANHSKTQRELVEEIMSFRKGMKTGIVEMAALASGIIGVKGSDGKYTAYVDLNRWDVREPACAWDNEGTLVYSNETSANIAIFEGDGWKPEPKSFEDLASKVRMLEIKAIPHRLYQKPIVFETDK